ncbi:phosphotransferase enzyme family protein [Modestobacter altitudinis]|uniref:phosphotransferase enzyme family protein n=1 Tax=Modestobacter altitudinis TaxID=2213158 RepID=UPI001C55225E|nr:phosphotransferase [Modestobacter altitudinis]
MTEEPLPTHASSGVVRVGDTVRRPSGPWTDSVDALLAHLHGVGFRGAPRPLGRDGQGRQVLEYLPGVAGSPDPDWTDADLRELGGFLRQLHEATASFPPPAGAVWQRAIAPDREDLVVHNDPAPWNLVRSPAGWALIDWDFAGPGSRLWDLSYAVQTAVPLHAGRPVSASLPGLRAMAEGYGLDGAGRAGLVPLLHRRVAAMVELLRDGAASGEQPWARIWTEDGSYWQRTADHLAEHRDDWAAALGC